VTSVEMLGAIVLQGLLTGYQRLVEEGIEILLPFYLDLLNNQRDNGRDHVESSQSQNLPN